MPKGTHVLQQVGSISQLNGLEGQLSDVLSHEGVTTLSIRVPWKAPGALDTIFARGLAMARAAGKKFSYRVMAGEHTPPALMGETWETRNGFFAPMPKMSNTTFFNGFEDMAETLGDLARAAGDDVEVLHFPGAGERWAELSNSPEVRAEVSREEFVEFHVALMDLARIAVVDRDVEFPMSGRGDLVWIIGQLALAAIPRGIIVQANGLADGVDKHWGSPDNATELAKDQAVFATQARRACQMIQPENTYNWEQIYLNCRAPLMEGIGAEYVEVYTPSFFGGTAAQLYAQAAIFLAEQEPEPGTCEEDLAAAQAALVAAGVRENVLMDQIADLNVDLSQATDKLEEIAAILVRVDV